MAGTTPNPNAVHARWAVVAALGMSTTLVWASSLSASDPGGSDRLGDRGFFDLGVCGFLGVFADRGIDRTIRRPRDRSARRARCAGIVECGAGCRARSLALATGPIGLFGAWAILGVGMALGLYDAGFATLTAIYGDAARGPITGITLFAGFSSTVSWPVSTVLNDAFGWRETCLVWAALNLLIGLPLNYFVLPKQGHPVSDREESNGRAARQQSAGRMDWRPHREMLLLAFVFAAGWFVTAAMAAHLPTLLHHAGLRAVASSRRRGVVRTCAGGSASCRARGVAQNPSSGFISHSRQPSSHWRGHSGCSRPAGRSGFCRSPWRWQWSSDNCSGHGAARDFWSAWLRHSHRAARCSCSRCSSLCAAPVWILDGPDGPVCSLRHRRPIHCRTRSVDVCPHVAR